MTEYEMASLFNDMTMQLLTQVQLFFAVLTAFIVVSYVVAHRLTRPMTVVIVGLFLFMSLGAVLNIYRQSLAIGGLAFEMKAMAVARKGLAWHFTADLPERARWLRSGPGAAMFLFAAAAAIYFFFHCRRVNRKPAPEATPAQVQA